MGDFSKLGYRPCVGIMVLNAENKVWVGRRISETNTEYSGSEKRWQMPQGGIDKGEAPEPAGLRELYEETGIKDVSLLAQSDGWLEYDFPEHSMNNRLSSKWRGQKQMWYAYRFNGHDDDITINPPPDGNSPEFDDWRWEDMHRLPELIVDFKRDIYEKVVEQFGHLVSD